MNDNVLSQDDIDTLLYAVEDDPHRTQIDGDHYTRHSIQPWDALKDWLGIDGYRAYLRGNAVKYLCRAGSKGDALTDIKKAHHYLCELIGSYEELK